MVWHTIFLVAYVYIHSSDFIFYFIPIVYVKSSPLKLRLTSHNQQVQVYAKTHMGQFIIYPWCYAHS